MRCHDHDHDRDALVTLMLLVPKETATDLVGEIDGHKQRDGIGSVTVNVRHIVGVTSPVVPAGMDSANGWYALGLGVWWPWNVLLIAAYGAAGLALGYLAGPHAAAMVAGLTMATGWRVTRARGWRRGRRPDKMEQPSGELPTTSGAGTSS